MRRIVEVKNIKIGEGIPKVCVSMTGENLEELKKEAHVLKTAPLDIVEWRADFFDKVQDILKVKETLKVIGEILYDIPILFTFRSKKEGGAKNIDIEYYKTLILCVAEEKSADLIDIELFMGDDTVKELIEKCHENGGRVVISNHDFQNTPRKEEIVARLKKMQMLGADIAKIAVMPRNSSDVIELLSATNEMNQKCREIPIITMSMSGIGVLSRVAGEIFGSAVTFGAVRKPSAPGQIGIGDLNSILKVLHESLNK